MRATTVRARRVKEVARPFSTFTPFREATLDHASRTARVVLLTEGLGNL
jgi:hypothetical protein